MHLLALHFNARDTLRVEELAGALATLAGAALFLGALTPFARRFGQLLGGAALADRPPQAPQRVAEKLPVGVGERRREVGARHELSGLLDPVREMRRTDIDLAHAGMQPFERVGEVGRSDRSGRRGFVVGPQRDHEAVTLVDARLHAGIESGHRAAGCGEPLGKLDFEGRGLMRDGCHPGQDVTGQQAHGDPVRVVQNDRVVDGQTER